MVGTAAWARPTSCLPSLSRGQAPIRGRCARRWPPSTDGRARKAAGDGWDGQSDAETTAAALSDLARARERGRSCPRKGHPARRLGRGGACLPVENLWERAALLASAMTLAGERGAKLLDSVHEKGKPLSPFAQLVLAEAYLRAGKSDWAPRERESRVGKRDCGGRMSLTCRRGEHPGWAATTVETTRAGAADGRPSRNRRRSPTQACAVARRREQPKLALAARDDSRSARARRPTPRSTRNQRSLAR